MKKFIQEKGQVKEREREKIEKEREKGKMTLLILYLILMTPLSYDITTAWHPLPYFFLSSIIECLIEFPLFPL